MSDKPTATCGYCHKTVDECHCWDKRLLGADERFVKTIQLTPEEEELIDRALDDYPNMQYYLRKDNKPED